MICLADDPSEAEFHVACYHRDLEPFMARGRELRAQGKRHAEVDSIRLADVRSGSLPMPNHPAALYSLTGSADSVDSAGVPHGAAALYVVYIPYATPETTGLTTNPSSKEPWLMAPGKPWAHIMIVP
jgi:hypothetical protein